MKESFKKVKKGNLCMESAHRYSVIWIKLQKLFVIACYVLCTYGGMSFVRSLKLPAIGAVIVQNISAIWCVCCQVILLMIILKHLPVFCLRMVNDASFFVLFNSVFSTGLWHKMILCLLNNEMVRINNELIMA
jgi:hypothetical protein